MTESSDWKSNQIKFPEQGLDADQVFAQMTEAASDDVDWKSGRLGLYVHSGGEDVLAVAQRAYQQFFSTNALGANAAFPSLAKFEREVVQWTGSILGASANVHGNMTSGGTESIFLAMKSIRDWARSQARGGAVPEVIAPYSAHPAFSKAAYLLGMQVTRIALDAEFKADTQAMARAVSENTIGIIGSSPSFPHGVIDPIESLAEIALEHDLWMHVDACVGGYFLPFMRRAGHHVPAFDFSVDGVRSMSADTHKYGFAAKGASTILYRDEDCYSHQIYEFDDWPKGRYAAPTAAGSRPGGAIAAAWAVMRYLGTDGYTRIATDILKARDTLLSSIRANDALCVWGDPIGPIITYGSPQLDIFAIAEELEQRGWIVSRGAQPPSIHMGMLTAIHVEAMTDYAADLNAATEAVRGSGRVAAPVTITYGS